MKPLYSYHSYRSGGLAYLFGGHKPSNLHKWGPGVRDVYALHYIVSGKGKLETRSKTFSLQAGESFVIFPDTEVYYYPDPHDPWEYVWVEFTGEEAVQLLSLIGMAPDKPVAAQAPDNLQSSFYLSWNAEARPFEKMRADAKLRLLLSYYMEYFSDETAAVPTDYVSLAKRYIAQHFWKSTITVAEVVHAVNIERSYLFRLFKEATGMSVSGYLASYRIQRACELLRSSNLSIKSVAYSVGYKDQLYFSKAFKKATSYTPSEYMMLHRSSEQEC